METCTAASFQNARGITQNAESQRRHTFLMMINILPPFESPTRGTRAEQGVADRPRLRVRHPAYAGVSGGLLSLVAGDGESNATCGVQYGLVHSACVVITERSDLWLSQSERPSDPPYDAAYDDILPSAVYYLHVPRPADFATPSLPSGAWSYPIVPNFRSWAFPHASIPSPWTQVLPNPSTTLTSYGPTSTVPIAIKMRDNSCRLTHYCEATESAHILPLSEKAWFGANGMDEYRTSNSKTGQDVIDAECNIILLREDVHSLWDKMKFMAVPKRQHADASPVLVAHVSDTSQELHSIYHNRPLQLLQGIPPEYMFARFAWHIFPELRSFLQKRQKRVLAVRQEDGTIEVREHTAEECLQFCLDQGRGRSASPTKRKRPEQESLDRTSFDSGISGLESRDLKEQDEEYGSFNTDHVDIRNGTEALNDTEYVALNESHLEDPFGCKRRLKRRLMEQEEFDTLRPAKGNSHIEGLLNHNEGRGRKRHRD